MIILDHVVSNVSLTVENVLLALLFESRAVAKPSLLYNSTLLNMVTLSL